MTLLVRIRATVRGLLARTDRVDHVRWCSGNHDYQRGHTAGRIARIERELFGQAEQRPDSNDSVDGW